jgi:hypothetical protein
VNGITTLQSPNLIERQVIPDYVIADRPRDAGYSSGFSGKRGQLLVRSMIFT